MVVDAPELIKPISSSSSALVDDDEVLRPDIVSEGGCDGVDVKDGVLVRLPNPLERFKALIQSNCSVVTRFNSILVLFNRIKI